MSNSDATPMNDTDGRPMRRRRRRTRRPVRREQRTTQSAEPRPAPEPAAEARSRRDRRSAQRAETPAPSKFGSLDVVVHQHDARTLEVEPLNPDIYIYTYTLRPRSLLDNHNTGPGVAERMMYEDSANPASPAHGLPPVSPSE